MHDMTVQQRKELMEKGPFNLVFHGVEPGALELLSKNKLL